MKAGAPETQPDSVVLGLVGARTAEHRKHSADQQRSEPIKGSLPLPIARNGAAWPHPAKMRAGAPNPNWSFHNSSRAGAGLLQ